MINLAYTPTYRDVASRQTVVKLINTSDTGIVCEEETQQKTLMPSGAVLLWNYTSYCFVYDA
jgi:hypothetical protein